MKKRAFWFSSLTLVLLAISLHLGGIGAVQKRVQLWHDAMNTKDIEQQQALKVEEKKLSQIGNERIILGWISGIISVVCLYFSYRRDETAPRSILIVLLAFYLLLQFGAA
ncbi:MAG TPA: hypothetical protein VK840_05210 [Candidatus Dormibacteraeota bacterium]|jgi:hypothetical protein|nr:hypothetical protein [Candidatus Dormibacteraeota bacterium]